jgi:hypothetical protein
VFLTRAIPHGQTILVLICVGGFGVSLLINYPGFMSTDSYVQLFQARKGVYSNDFPPFMAFLWHLTDRIVAGPFGMLVLITALIWLGTFLVTLYWFNKERFTLLSLFPALIIFYPPLFGISGVIWHDNLMWAFLMLALGTVGSLEPVSRRRRRWACLKLGIIASLLLMAMLTRHNAGFAAVPIMILSIVRFVGKDYRYVYRIAVPSVVGLLVCVMLQFCAALTTEYLATYKTNFWVALAIFDVAGIIYRMPDQQQQETSYARVPTRLQGSLDQLLKRYDPGDAGRLLWSDQETLAFLAGAVPEKRPGFGCTWQHDTDSKRIDKDPSAPHNNLVANNGVQVDLLKDYMGARCFKLTAQEKTSLIQLWSTLVIHHPLAYLFHKMSVFRGVIGRHDYSDYVFMQNQTGDWPADWAPKIYGPPMPTLNWFQTKVKSLLLRFSAYLWPIYMPLSYLVLTIATIGACLLSYTEERLQIALIATSGLSLEMGLFLLAPASDYRYSHYMVYTSVLALLLLMRTHLMGSSGAFQSDVSASSPTAV